MNKKQVAELLEGRTYGDEDKFLCNADTSRVLIIFGASDDFMQLRGFISADEVSCYGGGDAFITDSGLLTHCDEECDHYIEAKEEAHKITAIWDEEGYSWVYETELPHVTFDIFDEGEPYCRGIVIDLKDI